jgi:glycosyltransferase involved in cell wall biosynthesis
MKANGVELDKVQVIIPAYNEEPTIGKVIERLQVLGLRNIRVVNNASDDKTAVVAEEAGAEVICEPVKGYGKACWTGYQTLSPDCEWVLFCDADGSDELEHLPDFFAVVDDFDFILANRRVSKSGRQAMTPIQNFGNAFATTLIQLGWRFRYHDLGPLRLIRRQSLESIGMRDRNFGWTVEMQIRAIEYGLRIKEIPMSYLPRQGGQSKISGTVSGTIKAGSKILWTVFRYYLRSKFSNKRNSPSQ